MTWRVTTDRNGRRCYYLPTGQVVSRDGCGSMPVTVYYAGYIGWSDPASEARYGMTDTVREGKAWAEQDEAERSKTETPTPERKP